MGDAFDQDVVEPFALQLGHFIHRAFQVFEASHLNAKLATCRLEQGNFVGAGSEGGRTDELFAADGKGLYFCSTGGYGWDGAGLNGG